MAIVRRNFRNLFSARRPGLAGAVLLALLLGLAAGANAQQVTVNPHESVPTEPEFTVAIDIDCGADLVKGVELKIAFDPFLVRLDAVTPGDWYTGSGQGFYFFDYTDTDPQGLIHLASAVLTGSHGGTGTLAICHFTMLDFGISPLIFQDVDVRGVTNTDLGFVHSTGDRIILDPVVAVVPRSFGAVKAIYR